IVFVSYGVVIALVSPLLTGVQSVPLTFLYPLRIISYILLAVIISQMKLDKTLVINALIAVAVFTAIFGWFQYILLPDLTAMKIFGWDDHYFRMVGTFFDPAFFG